MLSPSRFLEQASARNANPFPATRWDTSQCISGTEADALLQTLLQARCPRLTSEYDDPLGMLFNDQARQWTLGWGQGLEPSLFLLVWETDSWSHTAFWRLYRNGTLIFEELDGAVRERSQTLHKLLESPNLPTVTPQQLLERLIGYQHSHPSRFACLQALNDTLNARPEIMASLKAPLMQQLEADLYTDDWPVLDILKVHRLAHKNGLLHLLQQPGRIISREDKHRLEQAIQTLLGHYYELAPRLTPMFQPALQEAYREFQGIRAKQGQAAVSF